MTSLFFLYNFEKEELNGVEKNVCVSKEEERGGTDMI